jgi:histidinol dehydrogenase
MLSIPVIRTTELDPTEVLQRVREKLNLFGEVVAAESRRRTEEVFGEPLTPRQVVEQIGRDVWQRGWEAVAHYTAKLDRVRLTPQTVRVSVERLAEAHRSVERDFLETVRRVRRHLEQFQAGILTRTATLHMGDRWTLQLRYQPIARVGVCVPGGAAAYPSTVLMTVVPALVAGVPEIAVISPPTANGADNPYVQATCYELGVRELYRIGGAQGVFALAFGVEGIRAVDKIVGPGNIFVTLAKREVYGFVDIDMLAGPTELVVLADEHALPAHVASDLIAQAEHAPGSSILITWCDGLIDQVLRELERQLLRLPRGELARQSLEEYGALIQVRDAEEAVEMANRLAPEHVHINTEDCWRLSERIRAAGAIFLGPYTPVAVGDYVAGPSHVLPTGGTARFRGGLSALDFLRHSSVLHFTRSGLEEVAADVRKLATIEGLTGHQASVDVRLD